ncbi:FAD/NAD(P)-binding domain-containing protein [Coniophora puteana RWD-64-598 SS2]|uniref:FAD/NAD(P)-binding domain-containing protein n=1 Tax=Coniophora puteana (strain RWD-64-598) TaxID=741705 RepID=R7SEG1_CONPW|nr:FAD/NAD(P)-binding domain-containing protein [Coniophora puteana RWD-64-598 SS2]EIW74220.1 FAD/NAD(P)-binding domain-containing protein [Coniophora puteana RWD-64-598 SS2]
MQHLRYRFLPSRATTQAVRLVRSLLSIIFAPVTWVLRITYVYIQFLITLFFQPKIPPRQIKRPYGRIAVIGAGLTGVSSAAHAISHGFEVVIYEACDRTGGIWARENRTSGLQLNSILYRFHPSVIWKKAFPQRDEILDQINKVWKEYRLEERTRFNTSRFRRNLIRLVPPAASNISPSQWFINNGEDGPFDAIIVTIGTCGEPNWVQFEGLPKNLGQKRSHETPQHDDGHEQDWGTFKGTVLHSCELDSATEEMIRGKNVVVVGSGASGVEAVETLLERKPKHVVMLAKSDKWIIPRNVIIDTALAAQPFGRNMPLSFIWSWFLSVWQYHGVEELIPDKGVYTDTPVVNDVFLDHVRAGRCSYVRCETERFTKRGALVKLYDRIDRRKPSHGSHSRNTHPEEPHEEEIEADVVVLATGYKKPSMDFLPQELFPEGYERPNLYLQNFSTEDWSCLMTNSAYINAIGTVGHVHIGFYTRILLTLLLDPDARPMKKDMKLWVDLIRYVKRGASGGALGFFTYAELTVWLVLFHIVRPDRLRWLFFIWPGWGVHPDDESLYPNRQEIGEEGSSPNRRRKYEPAGVF